MIRRRVVVPTDVERLWRALTDPEEAGRWLGGRLDWTPEEGGGLRFAPAGGRGDGRRPGDRSGGHGPGGRRSGGGGPGGDRSGGDRSGGDRSGGVREGRVEEVVPGRYLRFVWWPTDTGPDGASEVAYSLEPVVPGPGLEGAAIPGGEDGEAAAPATILTVEEVPAAAPASVGPSASIASSWSRRDELEWRMWASRETAGREAAGALVG